MKKWKVLPTDPRFKELTEEQIDWLFYDDLLDDPDKMRLYENSLNREFMDKWQQVQDDEDPDISDVDKKWNQNLKDQFDELCKKDPIDKNQLSKFDRDYYKGEDYVPSVEEVKQQEGGIVSAKEDMNDKSKWEEVD